MSSEEIYQIVNITNNLIYQLSNETLEGEHETSSIDDNITKEGVKHDNQDDKCLNSLYIVFGIACSIILVLTTIIVMIKKINCIKKENYFK